MRNSRKERIYSITGSLVSVAALSVLVWMIYRQATLAGGLWVDLSIPGLLLATAFLTLHFGLAGLIWVGLLKELRVDRSMIELLGVWAYTQPARYLPGKFWHIGNRFLLCEQRNIPREAIIISLYLENLIAVVAAIVWVTVTVLPDLLANYWLGYTLTLIAVGVILIMLIRPQTVTRLLSFWGKPSEAIPPVRWRSLLVCGLVWIINFMILGFALKVLMKGMGVSSPFDSAYLSGAFLVAWLFSGLFIITPQGLGIREGVFALLLSPWLPIGAASFVAIIFRICTLAADLLLAAIFFGANTYRRIVAVTS